MAHVFVVTGMSPSDGVAFRTISGSVDASVAFTLDEEPLPPRTLGDPGTVALQIAATLLGARILALYLLKRRRTASYRHTVEIRSPSG